jgi:hypothetical protein
LQTVGVAKANFSLLEIVELIDYLAYRRLNLSHFGLEPAESFFLGNRGIVDSLSGKKKGNKLLLSTITTIATYARANFDVYIDAAFQCCHLPNARVF